MFPQTVGSCYRSGGVRGDAGLWLLFSLRGNEPKTERLFSPV